MFPKISLKMMKRKWKLSAFEKDILRTYKIRK